MATPGPKQSAEVLNGSEHGTSLGELDCLLVRLAFNSTN